METRDQEFFNLWKRKELKIQEQVLEKVQENIMKWISKMETRKRKIREDFKKVKRS